jgi:O-antigen ligase
MEIMPSNLLFLFATLLLSLNFVRPFGFAISDWLFLGSLGFAFIETLSVDRGNTFCWWRNRFLWMAGLILAGALLSLVNSHYFNAAINEIFQQIYVMTLFISLAWIMVRRGKTNSIILALIISGVFTSGIACIDFLTGSRIGPLLSGNPPLNLLGRYAGTLGHPNNLGYFLVLTVLLSIGYWINISRSEKKRFPAIFYNGIWFVLVIIQSFGIYLSNSLTAYLGFLLGLITLLFSLQLLSKKNLKIVLVGLSVIVLSTIILTLFSKNTATSISNALNRVISTTAGSRITGYSAAWNRITQNPLIGVGYDQIATSGTGLDVSVLGTPVHNIFLQIWYTGGFLAFLGWLSIYFSIGWAALVTLNNKLVSSPIINSLAASMLAIILMDQFQDASSERVKWLVIGLFVGWVWIKQRTSQIKSEV